MTLRKLYKADLQQLIQLEETTQAVPWSDEAFRHCLDAGYQVWGVEIDSKLIGFIIISVKAGESHIMNICVDPHHQRQGYGLQLLEHGLKEARAGHADIAILEVRQTNTKAIRLYKKLGFIQIGVRKDYYPVPTGREDALMFAKDLVVK